ncbi:MAG: hypothetical protein AAGN82_07605 [Myxococcota bacterium]
MGKTLAHLALTVALTGCGGCDEEEPPVEAPVLPEAQGQATEDVVATGIGNGLAMRPGRPPSSVRWQRVLVIDENRALLTGRALDRTFAVVTDDRGQSWRMLSADAPSFAGWAADADGHIALVTGSSANADPRGGDRRGPAIRRGEVRFLTTVGDLTEPGPFFGEDVVGASAGSLRSGVGRPVVFGSELASMLLHDARATKVAYAVPPGADVPAAKALPPGDWVTVPYGRPPHLLSVVGGRVLVYPWPRPDEDLATAPVAIAGVVAGAARAESLSRRPHCEHGPWTFHRWVDGNRSQVIGVSPQSRVAFSVPPGPGGSLGCRTDAVSVDGTEADGKTPRVTRCSLDGRCTTPKTPPFEVWDEEHDRRIHSVPTPNGMVAVMMAKSGERWGTYLAVSTDDGATFDLPRRLGEGQGDRGRIEVDALFTMGDRIVMVVSAEVTGSSRRGFYTLVSDDGGRRFGPP